MGRLSKIIKRELIQEANRRLLNEQNISGAHCYGDTAMGGNGSTYMGSPCECKPIYPHPSSPYGPPATYTTMEQCWNDSSNCCSGPNANIKYRVRLKGCPSSYNTSGGDWGLFNLRTTLDGQPVQPSDINKVVSLDGWYDHNGPGGAVGSSDNEWAGCCKITGVEYWEPNSYSDAMTMLPLVTDSNCNCDSRKRYRCKGPIQQATAIRERANFDNTSSCVEDRNGEFATYNDCMRNCVADENEPIAISESELRRIVNRVINEDVDTTTPKFKVDRGLLDIGGSKYKLESEKMWVRIGIDIVKVSITDDGGLSLTVEHPISGKLMTNEIRQKNVDKVIRGAANNEDEIMVKNLDGKEFYLVRV